MKVQNRDCGYTVYHHNSKKMGKNEKNKTKAIRTFTSIYVLPPQNNDKSEKTKEKER